MKKKIRLLFMGLFFAFSLLAQNIVYDKTNLEGVRTVVCSGVNLGVSKNMDVYVALVGFQYKSTVKYAFAVSVGSAYKIGIPSTSECSIVLSNEKDYEFPVLVGGASVIQSIDVNMDDVYQTYRRFAYYNVKKKYLKKISKNAIVQFELDILPSDYSVGFNDNKLGDNISAAYATLDNLFNN